VSVTAKPYCDSLRPQRSKFSRLSEFEDVNDAERLLHDPAMRRIVGGMTASACAASASQIGSVKTKWLVLQGNLFALADLSGQWKDRVHGCRRPRGIALKFWAMV
jgi:hypothetical protein